jgi:ubiquitin fusion degradation protein 1
MFHRIPSQTFSQTFRCYPVSLLPGNERENVAYGGKIILPPSALQRLASLNIAYPMLFELNNDPKATTTHGTFSIFIRQSGCFGIYC